MLKFLAVTLVVSAVLAAPSTKIESRLASTLATKGSANVLVSMKEGTAKTLASLKNFKYSSRGERVTTVAHSLMKNAEVSQKSVISLFSKQKKAVDYEVFWITNQVYIKNADADLIQQVASLDEVSDISEEFEVKLDPIIQEKSSPRRGILAEWGIESIRAHHAWALPGGNMGENIIVAGIDTGVMATHQDLASNFVGVNYGWRDFTILQTPNPRDGNGHGTHTMGTIVGQNGIGVAPGAKWMACKALNDQGSGTNAGLINCGQWVACPTLPNGNSPDCTKAPHVVSNSWGGGQANPFYNEVINAWHAADITPVFANGNSGEACQTANSPADSLAGVVGVGSTDNQRALSYFSSKGPTLGGRQKPDISAPGSAVRSAWIDSNSSYNTISGTSMACPHVAGVVALLKSRNPTLSWTQVQNTLYTTASHEIVPGNQACGGIPETSFPNMAFGHGIVDAAAALQEVIDGRV